MNEANKTYIPAAGRDWRLPFYDLMAKLLGADRARASFIEGVSIAPGARILEIGCGTGSMLLVLKQVQPMAELAGLDPDPKALALARRKAERAGVAVRLDQGYAEALGYGSGTFDHVVSSLMYHHLSASGKEQMLQEVGRVLKPGGLFHMLDFDGAEAGKHAFLARRMHVSLHLEENSEDRVLERIRGAGFADAVVVGRQATRLSRMVSYRARAPEARDAHRRK